MRHALITWPTFARPLRTSTLEAAQDFAAEDCSNGARVSIIGRAARAAKELAGGRSAAGDFISKVAGASSFG
eukprot:13321213-Alexandrium_andersonii.AAC.1